ncbi:DNA replication protein DnaC [Brassicibacter mesophilus]
MTTATSYECELCKDTEWIDMYDEDGRITSSKPCKCREIKTYKRMLQESGISSDFLEIGFKEFETEGRHETVVKAKESAITYVKHFMDLKDLRKNSITFLSKNIAGKKTGIGAGKTHLSIAIANNIMKKYRVGVLYMPYRDVITRLKQNMIDEDYYQKEVSKYKDASVLLIDDIFKGVIKNNKVNDTDINIMFEIINHRYLNKKPVICSSEFGIDELIEFDQATGSRIIEMSKDYLVEIGLSREEVLAGKTLNYRLS